MNERKNDETSKLKKEIVIERLMQAPPTMKISLGTPDGKFLDRDEQIKEIKKDSEIGEKIVNIQFAYLKAFKKGLFTKE